MRERLQDYVYGDPSARRRGDRLSLLAGFAWYLVSILLHLRGPVFQSVVILILLQLLMTLQYCLKLDAAQRSSTHTRLLALRREMLAPALRFSTVVLVAIFGGPALEAALINDRMRRLSETPDPRVLRTAVGVISAATTERIILSPAPIERLVVRRLALDDVLHAVLNNVNREAQSRNLSTPIAGLLFWGQGQETIDVSGFEPQSRQLRPGLVPPDMAAFAIPIGQGLPTLPGVGYVRIKGDNAKVTIHLDGLHCRNAIFTDCSLAYSGGAIQLENAGFYNCSFKFAPALKCQLLAESILADPSVTLSIS